jgi:hypothetical protein
METDIKEGHCDFVLSPTPEEVTWDRFDNPIFEGLDNPDLKIMQASVG